MKKRVATTHSRLLYYLQPDGTWKKGGDGRSAGKTLAEVRRIKGRIKR